jgi:hypothetical protein
LRIEKYLPEKSPTWEGKGGWKENQRSGLRIE